MSRLLTLLAAALLTIVVSACGSDGISIASIEGHWRGDASQKSDNPEFGDQEFPVEVTIDTAEASAGDVVGTIVVEENCRSEAELVGLDGETVIVSERIVETESGCGVGGETRLRAVDSDTLEYTYEDQDAVVTGRLEKVGEEGGETTGGTDTTSQVEDGAETVARTNEICNAATERAAAWGREHPDASPADELAEDVAIARDAIAQIRELPPPDSNKRAHWAFLKSVGLYAKHMERASEGALEAGGKTMVREIERAKAYAGGARIAANKLGMPACPMIPIAYLREDEDKKAR